jgi:hypothetical protein
MPTTDHRMIALVNLDASSYRLQSLLSEHDRSLTFSFFLFSMFYQHSCHKTPTGFLKQTNKQKEHHKKKIKHFFEYNHCNKKAKNNA